MKQMHEKNYILGIETSCDDTAIAIVDSERKILSNIVINQNNYHKQFGGIVPEIAARAHLNFISKALEKSLKKSKKKLNDIDLICATAGPGLIGGLIVGTTFAKTLSWSLKKPYVAVNHLEGHALTARLQSNIPYPYLLLLVSGGHTQLIVVKNCGDYQRISTTLDDAVGETFDKGAKMLALPFPGGPEIEKCGKKGNDKSFELPRPMIKSSNPNFSFSGLKTAFSKLVSNTDVKKNRNDLAASLEKAITDCIIDRTKFGIKLFKKMNLKTQKIRLVVAGGVASNSKIRTELKRLTSNEDIDFFAPPLDLCTDNGAMIAWAGFERFKKFGPSNLNFKTKPRWPLDPDAFKNNPTMKKIGKKGVKA